MLVLVGFLGEQVREYCGDGTQWGLRVRCVESPVEAETGQRIPGGGSPSCPCFLLMYCDNYWPMQLGRMWQAFLRVQAPAMLMAYSNPDGYSRNNLRVDQKGYIGTYDPERRQSLA